MTQSDDDMIKDIRQRLDDAAEQLDPAIAGRLRAARRTALEARPRPGFGYRPVLAGGVALATVVLVTVYIGRGPGGVDAPPVSLAGLANDMELISEADNLELFNELEFYQWLVENEQDAG